MRTEVLGRPNPNVNRETSLLQTVKSKYIEVADALLGAHANLTLMDDDGGLHWCVMDEASP